MVFIGNFKQMLVSLKTCGKAQEDRLCHRLSRLALTRASLSPHMSSRKVRGLKSLADGRRPGIHTPKRCTGRVRAGCRGFCRVTGQT